MVEVARALQRSIEIPRLIARRRRPILAAPGLTQFRIRQLALRPTAAGVEEVRNARRNSRPTPLGLLLVLHREHKNLTWLRKKRFHRGNQQRRIWHGLFLKSAV
jgi:hypothetical protein